MESYWATLDRRPPKHGSDVHGYDLDAAGLGASRMGSFGGFLVLLRFGILSYWMNSYWGGSVSATGAALVMGAFPRIVRSRRLRDVFVFGAGVTILTVSRPLEGFIFCFPVAAVLLFSLFRETASVKADRRVLLTLASMGICLFGFIAYYNWRVTNNPLVFPHFIEQREYVTTPVFIWEHAKPPLQYANMQLETFYNSWMPSLYRTSWSGAKRFCSIMFCNFGSFFWVPRFRFLSDASVDSARP